jgi:peptidoglycan/LPS O-acetylase OafA/YrhL
VATAAVTSFFVLSGFILTYQYWRPDEQDGVDKRHFYLARVARIVPVYWFSLILAVLLKSAAELPPTQMLPTVLASSFAFLQVWFPVLPVFFGVNPPAYSLAIEAFFYLIFPFIVGAFARRPLAGLLLSIPISLAFALLLPPQHNVWAIFILPISRMTEFALGMFSGVLFKRIRDQWQHKSVALLTAMEFAALTLVALLVIFDAPLNGAPDAPLKACSVKAAIALFASVAFFLLALGRGYISRALAWAPLLVLGEASYSLYLLHDIFTHWLQMQHFNLPWAAPWMYIAFTASATFLSYLCFKFIETPWRKKILAWNKGGRSLFLMAQVATVLLLLFGRVFIETPYYRDLREANSKPVVSSVVFEDGATLDRLYITKVAQGLELSSYWRTGVNPSRAKFMGVHILDGNREIVRQYDHELMPKDLPLSGTQIVDRFVVSDTDLPANAQIGLALYADPSATLTATGGTCDWGNHRLLIPLKHAGGK